MRVKKKMAEKLTRICIVDLDKCQPKKCQKECKKYCPVVKVGKMCIEIRNKASIFENLCIGCGVCVKKCPLQALQIINLPTSLMSDLVHRYGTNGFQLHRLPMPKMGQVLGLIGTNGIGKSTALKILAGALEPNLGTQEKSWDNLMARYRGSDLQNYFSTLLTKKNKVAIKLQYVDLYPKKIQGTVGQILSSKKRCDQYVDLYQQLDLNHLMERDIQELSGGELQRLALALTSQQICQTYIFDEPSSYLDINQRLKAACVIRDLAQKEKYVVVVEHDLSLLDYLSDFICVMYGQPGAYGAVTLPYNVREGINVFLDGFVPTENLRFRSQSLTFKTNDIFDESERSTHLSYPKMTKKFPHFTLTTAEGQLSNSEIIVLLGQNGTGKSTLIQLLAGVLEADNNVVLPNLTISYKPQKLAPTFTGTVRELLYKKLGNNWLNPLFQSDVYKPLQIESLLDSKVSILSGGEIQRLALTLVLGKPAKLYLIDEPSAYLDAEQRIIVAKIIKRWIYHTKTTAFIVEHDFLMTTYLADKVIVFEGQPGISAQATEPIPLILGMNKFLKSLNVTFRRDPSNFRARINKLNSVKDREQKESGQYFYLNNSD